MKIKTSVSISKKSRAAIQRIAKQQERSVSYVLEKFIEERAARIKETPKPADYRGKKKR